MTLAAQHPLHGRHWFSRSGPVLSAGGDLVVARAPGVAIVALLTTVLGAWAAIAVFVGPEFGWRPTVSSSWQWVMVNWLLHLVPGAAAFVGGLVTLTRSPARRGGPSMPAALAGLLVLAAGCWLVIGPASWPLFESAPAFNPLAGTTRSFLDQIGASLGPGVLLVALGGMALKASITRPKMGTAPAARSASAEETPMPAAGGDTAAK